MINRIARKIYNQYRLSIIARRIFDATLTDQQKILVDTYTNKRQQSLSFGPMFSSDRTYFDIGSFNLPDVPMSEEIYNVIDGQGYYCPDYRKGYVYKKDDKLKNKPVKLIKILKKGVYDNQQFNVLKKQFDERLQTSRKEMKPCSICITHNPYDVAGMSTDRNWTSCMNLNKGIHRDTVLKQVQYGGMCAYLIQNNDKEVERPIARIAIKRLVGENGGFMFVAQNIIYGDKDLGKEVLFDKKVEDILNESNKQTMDDNELFIRDDEGSWSDSKIIYYPTDYFLNNDSQFQKQRMKNFFELYKDNENILYDLIENDETPQWMLLQIAKRINNQEYLIELLYHEKLSLQILKQIIKKIGKDKAFSELAQNFSIPLWASKYILENTNNINILNELYDNNRFDEIEDALEEKINNIK